MVHTNTNSPRRAGLGVLVLLSVLGLGALLIALLLTDEDAPLPRPDVSAAPPASPPPPEDGRWDAVAEQELATLPMVDLPVQAAAPQPLSDKEAGSPITLPRPAEEEARWIPDGFPPTPEGAVAQLSVAAENGMSGVDPSVMARAFRDISAPSAPDPTEAGLVRTATSVRTHAGIPESAPVPTLLATFEVTHAQVKGTADDGRFAVVCVLGELAVDYQGSSAKAGVGECQAMRWTDGQWRIAPIVRAAAGPSAWPGSADASRAGYRQVRDA